MKATSLDGRLAINFLKFPFFHVLSKISLIKSRVPVIFGRNGTPTPFLNPEWTSHELLRREDTWSKALKNGQDFVDKLNGAREESPWSTVKELKVHLNPILEHHGKRSGLCKRTQFC